MTCAGAQCVAAERSGVKWMCRRAVVGGGVQVKGVRSVVPLSVESLSALLGYAENATRSAENKSRLVAVLDGCPAAHNGSLDVFIH
ncbi:Protein of unknown function, partial [Gryllus bimaculatus]